MSGELVGTLEGVPYYATPGLPPEVRGVYVAALGLMPPWREIEDPSALHLDDGRD